MTAGGYNLGAAHGTVTIDTSSAIASLTALRTAMEGMSSATVGTGEAVEKAVGGAGRLAQAATVAGVGSAVFLGVAIKQAAQFEFRMDAVRSVLGESGEVMDLLKAKIIDLGAETSFTTNEVANIAQNLGKLGLDAETMLNGALEAVTSLSAATETETDLSATILGAAINAYQLSGDDAMRVADLFTRAANQSASDVSTLGSGFTYTASTAKALGIPIEELIVMLEALNDRGLRGSVAGTSLNQALLAMTSPTNAARQKLDELGISMEDAEGNFVGVLPILKQLHEALADVGDVERLDILDTIYGTRGGRAILQLLSATTDDVIDASNGWNGYREGLETGANASEQAAQRLDNLSGSVEKLKGAMESLLITVGTPLLGTLKAFVDILTAAVDALTALNPKVIQFGTALAAPLAVFGTLLAISKIAGVSFLRMIPGMKTVAAVAGRLAGPLGILTAVLGALVFVWQHNVLGIRDFADALGDYLLPKLDMIYRIAGDVKDVLRAMWDGAFDPGDAFNNDAFGELLGLGGKLYQLGIPPEVGYSFVEFGKRFSRTVRRARNLARDTAESFRGMFDILTGRGSLDSAIDTSRRLQRLFGEDLGKAILRSTFELRGSLRNFFESIGDQLGLDIDKIISDPQEFARRMKLFANELSGYFTFFQKKVMPAFGRALNLALRGLATTLDFLTDNMDHIFDAMKAMIRFGLNPLETGFRVLGRLLEGDFKGALREIVNGIKDAGGAMLDFASAAGSIMLSLGSAILSRISDIDFGGIGSAIVSGIQAGFSGAVDLGTAVISFVPELASTIWGALGDFYGWVRSKLSVSGGDGTGGPESDVVNMGQVVLGFLAELGSGIWGEASTFSAWLIGKISAGTTFVVDEVIPTTLNVLAAALDIRWGDVQDFGSWVRSKLGDLPTVSGLTARLSISVDDITGELAEWKNQAGDKIAEFLDWGVGVVKDVSVGTIRIVAAGVDIVAEGSEQSGANSIAANVLDSITSAISTSLDFVGDIPAILGNALVGLGGAVVDAVVFAISYSVDGDAIYEASQALGRALIGLIADGIRALKADDVSWGDIAQAHIDAITTAFEYAIKGGAAVIGVQMAVLNLGKQILTAIGYAIAGLFTGLAQGIGDETGITDAAVGIFESITSALGDALSYVFNELDPAALLGDLGLKIWDVIIGAIKSVFSGGGDGQVEDLSGSMNTGLKKALPSGSDVSIDASIGEQIGNAVLSGIVSGVTFAIENGGALFDAAVSAMGGFIQELMLAAIDTLPGSDGWFGEILKSVLNLDNVDASDFPDPNDVPSDTIGLIDTWIEERRAAIQKALDDEAARQREKENKAVEDNFVQPEPAPTPDEGAPKILAGLGLGGRLLDTLRTDGDKAVRTLDSILGGTRDDVKAAVKTGFEQLQRDLPEEQEITLPKFSVKQEAPTIGFPNVRELAAEGGIDATDLEAPARITFPAPDISAYLDAMAATANASVTAANRSIEAGNSLRDGFTIGVAAAAAALGTLPGTITSVLATAASAAYNTGQQVGLGMAEGIRSQIGAAVAAATELANAVSTAASAALREASPSRVFISKGKNIGRGLIIGMESTFAQVEFAGRQLAAATFVDPDFYTASATVRGMPPVQLPTQGQTSAISNTYNTTLEVDMSRIRHINDAIRFITDLPRGVETVTSTSRKG